jgi:hypothetical protein
MAEFLQFMFGCVIVVSIVALCVATFPVSVIILLLLALSKR